MFGHYQPLFLRRKTSLLVLLAIFSSTFVDLDANAEIASAACSNIWSWKTFGKLAREIDLVAKCIDGIEDSGLKAKEIRDLLTKAGGEDYLKLYGASSVLGKLARPWVVSSDTHSDDMQSVYRRIIEIDGKIENIGEFDLPYVRSKDIWQVLHSHEAANALPTLAELRQTFEDALANAAGLFRSANLIPFETSEDIDKKIASFRKMAGFPASVYAVRSLILAAHALIIAKTVELDEGKNILKKALLIYEELLCSSASVPREFEFCQNINIGEKNEYFWRPLTGWRWLNDVIFERALLLILLGESEKAKKGLFLLNDWPPVTTGQKKVHGSSPFYSGLRSSVARKIVKHKQKFIDQIYIYQPIPGVSQPVRKYFSTKDAATFVINIIQQIDLDVLRSAKGLEYLKVVDKFSALMAGIERKDNVVVLGSFQDEGEAKKRNQKLSAILNDADSKLRLSVQAVPNGWYRVQLSSPLKDSEIPIKLKRLRSFGIEDMFVSRPTVP